ncbi:hypothetical protein NFI96_030569, partial [Prochilodus magdalenae]
QERQAVKKETSLVQALQESLSRLPTPEPTIFSGDPLKFTEWSTSFKALIERRCSNPADRLFYLQRYIAGEAKSFLEGSFYRKDEEAYQQAWKRLNARYGHSFVVHRAFREKLNMWPKIGGKDYIKLREFSDFLQTCSNAMPHIKGLQVLNDCEENQKMLAKLPEWVTSRCNRYVTKQLDQGEDYPSFNEFASFIAKEARIACNPVSSLHALKHSAESPLREIKRSKSNTFATNGRPQFHQAPHRNQTLVSVRELPPKTPSSVIKALESDFADTKSCDKSISQEDICFLQILKEGIQQNEHGHLEMPLPFKARPHLPDNKKLALARLKQLKRKLDRDPKFKNDYVRFMEGVFKDDDAEKVDTQPEPGKIWYIPHQGVYHPGKPDPSGFRLFCKV